MKTELYNDNFQNYKRYNIPKAQLVIDENGKTIEGTGKMICNWFEWVRDGKNIPKIHPNQKPVRLLKQLIEIFTDAGDVVIDPCAGSATTLRASMELDRNSYGFEISKEFYKRAKNEMLSAPVQTSIRL